MLDPTQFTDDSDTLEDIRGVLHHRGWTEGLALMLLHEREFRVRQLISPRKEPNENFSDDYLRGIIEAVDLLLRMPKVLEDYAIHKQLEEEQAEADPRQPDDRLHHHP